MSIVAQRLSRIKPSPTNVLTGKVAELKREGRDIIGLGAGGRSTLQTTSRRRPRPIDAGQTKYTPIPGTLALREAIAKFKRATAWITRRIR